MIYTALYCNMRPTQLCVRGLNNPRQCKHRPMAEFTHTCTHKKEDVVKVAGNTKLNKIYYYQIKHKLA